MNIKEDFQTIKDLIASVFETKSMEFKMVSNNLWKLRPDVSNALATYICKHRGHSLSDKIIADDIMHDVRGIVREEKGFFPRCFDLPS